MVRGLGSRVEDENRGAVVTEAGSYLTHIYSCITQLKAEGPSRTSNESTEEEKEVEDETWGGPAEAEAVERRTRKTTKVVAQL